MIFDIWSVKGSLATENEWLRFSSSKFHVKLWYFEPVYENDFLHECLQGWILSSGIPFFGIGASIFLMKCLCIQDCVILNCHCSLSWPLIPIVNSRWGRTLPANYSEVSMNEHWHRQPYTTDDFITCPTFFNTYTAKQQTLHKNWTFELSTCFVNPWTNLKTATTQSQHGAAKKTVLTEERKTRS